MYRFGDYLVDPACREIRRAGAAVHLEPQAFDLLVLLIEHRDRVVAKTDLLDGVWGHRFLSEANVTTPSKKHDGRSATSARRNTPFAPSVTTAIASSPDSPMTVRHSWPVRSWLTGREADCAE